jgi:hypothetical protein
MVNGFQFYCVINEYFRNESISFRVYPYNTKTSYFEVYFSWKGSWFINLNLPSTCSTLIKYAIDNGWVYNQEKKQMSIEQGDFLIELIEIENNQAK